MTIDKTSSRPPASLAAFADLLGRLPGPDAAARAAASARNDSLTKPAGALGRLETLAIWHCGWAGEPRPRDPAAQIVVFAGNHGVAARGVSAYPADVTEQMVANFRAGGAAINQLARLHGAALDVIPLELDRPVADFCEGPAMSEAEVLAALRIGWEAVDPAADLLILGEMGIANTTSAAALSAALFGGGAEDWAGPGTGVAGAAFAAKKAAIDDGLALHAQAVAAAGALGPIEALRRLGGREIAAMSGALLSARMQATPVLLDGFVATASAAVWAAMREGALDHCQAAHVSAEPGHRRLLAHLGLEPLLDLGMRLGEGSGGAAALGLLRAAIACQSGMASFDEAAVAGPA